MKRRTRKKIPSKIFTFTGRVSIEAQWDVCADTEDEAKDALCRKEYDSMGFLDTDGLIYWPSIKVKRVTSIDDLEAEGEDDD